MNVSVSTTEGAYPRGVFIRKQGSSLWSYVTWSPSALYVPVPLGIGTYYIIADWDPTQFTEPTPVIYNGGGGGKG